MPLRYFQQKKLFLWIEPGENNSDEKSLEGGRLDCCSAPPCFTNIFTRFFCTSDASRSNLFRSVPLILFVRKSNEFKMSSRIQIFLLRRIPKVLHFRFRRFNFVKEMLLAVNATSSTTAQWLWLSWQSSCF